MFLTETIMSIDSNNIEFSEKININFNLRIKQSHYLCHEHTKNKLRAKISKISRED